MVFSSLEFIFIFLPLFLIAYSASEKKFRNIVLVVSGVMAGFVVFHVLKLTSLLNILLFLAAVFWLLFESCTANEKRYRCVLITIASAVAGYVLFHDHGLFKPLPVLLYLLAVGFLIMQAYNSTRIGYQNPLSSREASCSTASELRSQYI